MIVGRDVLPTARAMDEVDAAIHHDPRIVLLAHAATPLSRPLADDAIIYNFEPLYEGCRSFSLGYLDLLRKHEVWDYQQRNVAYLASLGIKAKHVPYGWHQALERPVLEVEKDIDVLFIGSESLRRRAMLHYLQGRCKFAWVKNAYGSELDAWVARAKIVLNLHFTDQPHPLEVVRLAPLMAQGAVVVSELGWDDAENSAYAKGVAFSSAPILEALKWLQFPDCCRMLGRAAQKTIRAISFRLPT